MYTKSVFLQKNRRKSLECFLFSVFFSTTKTKKFAEVSCFASWKCDGMEQVDAKTLQLSCLCLPANVYRLTFRQMVCVCVCMCERESYEGQDCAGAGDNKDDDDIYGHFSRWVDKEQFYEGFYGLKGMFEGT